MGKYGTSVILSSNVSCKVAEILSRLVAHFTNFKKRSYSNIIGKKVCQVLINLFSLFESHTSNSSTSFDQEECSSLLYGGSSISAKNFKV